MKQLFEFFPLIIFFAVYYKSDKDLYLSIAAVIVATFISLIAIYFKERKISTMMLVSTIILVVFGGLSIFLKNEIFFKMKPTIINALFAAVLIGSTLINKPVLKLLLNSSLKLTDEGWGLMNKMWSSFFILLAINDLFRIWYHVSSITYFGAITFIYLIPDTYYLILS